MSGLSTKHVVLGLLIEHPGYGYDLQQRLEARVGFLKIAESAVYKILGRLEEDGWIEEVGDKRHGRTRRGAPRVMYRSTDVGRREFRAWMAAPCDRAVVRDTLQSKLALSDPADLPVLLANAEAQQRECMAELASLSRPALAQGADPDVPWQLAAVMMSDDFIMRWLQTLVDWLDAICDVIEERIERSGRTAPPAPR